MSPEYPHDDAATARAVVDDAGTLREWNEGARRLLGHTAEEVVGRPAAALLADPAAPLLPAPLPRRLDGVLELRHRDGHTVSVWVLAHHRPAGEDGPGHWLVVTPLEDTAPLPEDDPLARTALAQSPCATAVYDERLRLRRFNPAMSRTMGVPEDRVRGLRPSEIGGRRESDQIERDMFRVLTTGRAEDIRTLVSPDVAGRDSAWLFRVAPVTDDGGLVRGVCLTMHDFTEEHLARKRLQLVNEASVRIGTTLDVARTAQELAEVCVPTLADFVSIDLLDPPEDGSDPSPVSLTLPVVLRRVAHRSVTPDVPEVVATPGGTRRYPPSSPQATCLTTGDTVLAGDPTATLTEWLGENRERAEWVRALGIHSSMSVPIQARGSTLGVAVLSRFHRPEAFTPDDVLLAEEVTARAAVCIDNARRYSRERETALALQRSLLPQRLPRTAAVEAASRYLPAARAGVGGDWFDVIPLSGMRVAMVVGDVVGHGIRASATMGRLRTAVRTLADIDLAPDELLTHLDDLVLRLSVESGQDGTTGEVGATCLYAVYDPVSRRCTMARAGHPPPVMVPPGGGPARSIDLPAGPPLGLGGLPFEAVQVELPEDTVLGLYTDGLVESRERDPETSQRLLCEALPPPPGPEAASPDAVADSLDAACDRVLHALLPAGGAADDVALLLARTRGLPAAQVATWDIPADPSLVAAIRKQVVGQLERWRLTETAFTAELVVSELVTNAIRYGERPIRLRLIHDAAILICEVSDASPTAPHLRRAKTYDEGGRGLLLVAQLTQRWGTRHTPDGKTIWAEMALLEGW
ncbi:ATP-binding SpoIIE family protein phosphatase [Streptomyces griseoaurantiacus]|uniref:SpoIIE family protein phosphatase n=1 Tax=Streptomyces griseoaurantiacus TaxID=68213 RepID=A0A7W2DVC1_9ACTN|nr:SpoIIE family protein phosphatase [Streptomyces griseoaurantiacus]MBA5223668.1 SpoIIE family protein phosphatase [Streptomyces griseoaurantiacus]